MLRRRWEWLVFWYKPGRPWRLEVWHDTTDQLIAVYEGRTRRRLANRLQAWDGPDVSLVVL